MIYYIYETSGILDTLLLFWVLPSLTSFLFIIEWDRFIEGKSSPFEHMEYPSAILFSIFYPVLWVVFIISVIVYPIIWLGEGGYFRGLFHHLTREIPFKKPISSSPPKSYSDNKDNWI